MSSNRFLVMTSTVLSEAKVNALMKRLFKKKEKYDQIKTEYEALKEQVKDLIKESGITDTSNGSKIFAPNKEYSVDFSFTKDTEDIDPKLLKAVYPQEYEKLRADERVLKTRKGSLNIRNVNQEQPSQKKTK